MAKTSIEWTDTSWNPLRGCSRVSEGCRHCYAESVANRFKRPGMPYEGLIAPSGQWNGKINLIHSKLREPFTWRKPRRVFVNSMSDLFHEKVPSHFIDDVFLVMAQCPEHIFQILTKRPERMREYFEGGELENHLNTSLTIIDNPDTKPIKWPLPNVWLGVSVEDQQTADERLPDLLNCPAAIHWASVEPLLGPLDLSEYVKSLRWHVSDTPMESWLNWVVVGGESGCHARPMEAFWVRSLRDQCKTTHTPFFFKQWGEYMPDRKEKMIRVGKKNATRFLDSVEWNQYPTLSD